MKPIYIKNYINEDILFYLKTKINWLERTSARYECFMSKETITYTYGKDIGKRTYTSIELDPIVRIIMEKLNEEYNTNYDICFLNMYDNEKQHLGWHSDNSPEINIDHPIAVISFGAERDIWWKLIGYKGEIPNENRQLLNSGSLFIMPSGFQKEYLHKIPKCDKKCKTRISLTFRNYEGL